MPQSQKSLANICLFCGDRLDSPLMCTYCGFRFCAEHKPTDAHQCIKTRYTEYIKKTNSRTPPNIVTGKFRVVCKMCGFNTSKGVPIEYAGEELVQHMQTVGCSQNIFLEEVKEDGSSVSVPPRDSKIPEKINPQLNNLPETTKPQSTSIVDQIIQLSSLKEKGLISEEEFSSIKKELIKKLQ